MEMGAGGCGVGGFGLYSGHFRALWWPDSFVSHPTLWETFKESSIRASGAEFWRGRENEKNDSTETAYLEIWPLNGPPGGHQSTGEKKSLSKDPARAPGPPPE